MVSTLNGTDNAGRASSSQREPQRGAEAIANFYGRYSTDHGSVRAKNTETSLSSYAGSIRRSSSGTEFYSHTHSVNGGDEADTATEGATQTKAPRLYTSFSAAAAAASRSSLHKRGSQTSLPSNAPPSPSVRNSPSLSSPHASSSAFGDLPASNSGGAVSGLASSSAANKGTSFDIASANQYTPGSLANTFPWLSSNPSAASRQDRASPSAQQAGHAPSKLDSPPVSQYSKGKGFGYNPGEDTRVTKSGSKLRAASGNAKSNMHDTRDSMGRGLGLKSTSELDLPERMRSQRKAALAPPRLSQDPIAVSIEEELRPQASAPKNDSAFSRLGRAFRRKSKTGSDFRVDLSAESRDAPPLPKTPRRIPSQALPVKPTDPFAEKALKASSGFVDASLLRPKASPNANGKQRESQEWRPQGSTSVETFNKRLDSPPGRKSAVYGIGDRPTAREDLKRPSEQRDSVSVIPQDHAASARTEPDSDLATGQSGESWGDAHRDTVTTKIVSNDFKAPLASSTETTSADAQGAEQKAAHGTEDEDANQVEAETQSRPPDADTGPLTTDSDHVRIDSNASAPVSREMPDSSKRPTSMESTTSSARRRSLAFLGSAISMGAIAADTEKETHGAEKVDAQPDNLEGNKIDVLVASNDSDVIDPSGPSLTSHPAIVARTDSNASLPKQPSESDHTEPTFTAMSRLPSSDRKRLEPKSATRNDEIPSILSDFLSMDASMATKDAKKGKSKTTRAVLDDPLSAETSTDSSSVPLERSASATSATSEGRKSSFSTSPKATRATKGVYMSPPAGPSMGGFVSPFYVAPLTSVDSGLANRPSRPTGRRASASSRSVHSDDSRSIQSGPQRGSASLAVPESTPREAQSANSTTRTAEGHGEQARESAQSEKARKVKSFGNLRASAADQSQEAVPRASTSRLPSPSVLANVPAGQSRGASAAPSTSGEGATSKDLPNTPRESTLARSQSVSQRLSRRPKTSGAEAGLGSDRLASEDAEGLASSRRGSGPGRSSLDESGRSSKPYSTSPTETGFELLDSRDMAATPTNLREATDRQRSVAVAENGRLSSSDRRDSSLLGRRPSEQSMGAITPSSSRIESSGGAAALFGNPTTRPRTSSLLPSFGFSRSRTGSSAGLEGSGKSPGSFGNGARSASGAFWREPGDPLSPSGTTSQSSDINAASRSPRASSSSRPSFSRQLSASTGLSDVDSKILAAKPEKKFSLSAFLPYDDEEAPEYAERIASTAPKTQIAAILASSPDTFYVDALHHFMTRFWFNGLPLDIALRKLLMDLHLPKETQQIDRVMEAFAKRYNECNGGLFASDDQPYILSFSLMMLHTDAFNKNAKNKMTKADYLRNTGSSGVPTEILEYLYDNLTFTQFIYIEDEEGGRRRPSEASGLSLSGPGTASLGASSAAANNRTKIDPYYLITQGRLGELRPDLEHVIPEDTPFAYTGTLPTFDVDRLNSAFLHAPSIEIVTTKNSGEQPGASTPTATEEEVVSLKVTKVGVVNRKDDVSDGGKKSASRKWKTSGLLLTGSQLLLFKDIIWINALQSQILDQVGHSLLCNGIPTDDQAAHEVVEGGVVISPRITYFRPDGVISLADAVAVKDHSYGKYDFVFRLLAAKGRQYLVQAQSEDDMNDWIHKINFCASFRTSNIKIRGLDLAPRVGSNGSAQDLDAHDRNDALDSRFGRPPLSRTSFSESRLDLDDSGRSTPVPDDTGDSSRDGTLRLSVNPMSRNSESDGPPRPRSSASHRMSPASSALQKRAKARRELMLTKIAETEVQLERAAARLADEIRLARHFAILTPFLKSTRDRIEMSALPLASRIRALRLDVAKAESRCKILRLDLAAGERVARALLPNTHLSSSAMRAANRMPSAQMATPQLLELGSVSDSQAQFEELFAPIGSGINGASTYDSPSTAASLSGTVNKPASHQRNQMNLNAVSEQPADESPVMSGRRQMLDVHTDGDGDGAEQTQDASTEHGAKRSVERPSSPSHSVLSHSSAEIQERNERRAPGSAADEVPEDWDLSQVARPGTNRISLVDLPSPDELQEATGGRFRFGIRSSEE